MVGETDLAPYQVIIFEDPFEDPEEVARIDITGQAIGEQNIIRRFQTPVDQDPDPTISQMTDGRELLRYIHASYTTGYTIARYNSERTHEILEEFSDDEYADWKASTDLDTTLG